MSQGYRTYRRPGVMHYEQSSLGGQCLDFADHCVRAFHDACKIPGVRVVEAAELEDSA